MPCPRIRRCADGPVRVPSDTRLRQGADSSGSGHHRARRRDRHGIKASLDVTGGNPHRRRPIERRAVRVERRAEHRGIACAARPGRVAAAVA